MRKTLRRAATILQNALNTLLQPVFNIVLSLLVIRLTSDALWGEFVAVLVGVQLAAHIAGWGNREYLLRAFSRSPGQMAALWQRSLTTRLGLFVLLSPLLLLLEPSPGVVLWGAGIVLAQSYDVLIVYRKAFVVGIVVEALGTLALVGAVLAQGAALTAADLMLAFALVQTSKALLLSLVFRGVWAGFALRIDPAYFKLALPFFLLGFSGLLATRIDLYAVSIFLSEREVGQYQVFINLMIYVQSVSNFVLLPYVKSVYRLGDSTIFKLAWRLFLLGLLITPPALLAVNWLLGTLYDIHYSAGFVALGGAFVLPIFAYLPLIYRLYKLEQQNIVLKVNLFAAGANLILNLLLLPLMGIAGALLASALMQWAMLALYIAGGMGRALPDLPPDTRPHDATL